MICELKINEDNNNHIEITEPLTPTSLPSAQELLADDFVLPLKAFYEQLSMSTSVPCSVSQSLGWFYLFLQSWLPSDWCIWSFFPQNLGMSPWIVVGIFDNGDEIASCNLEFLTLLFVSGIDIYAMMPLFLPWMH